MSNSNIFCSICSENFCNKNSKNNCVTACGHIYHNECITQWLQQAYNGKTSCPDCRSLIPLNSVKPIYLHFTTNSLADKNVESNQFHQNGYDFDEVINELSLKNYESDQLRAENKKLKAQLNEINERLVTLNENFKNADKFSVDKLKGNESISKFKRNLYSVDNQIDAVKLSVNEMEISILKAEQVLLHTELVLLMAKDNF